MKSKVLALSAISAGFIAIFLSLGAYIEFVDLFALVMSSIFGILPLYLKSYKGSILSCLAGCVIAFLCSGFNVYSIVFPAYICFFGVYPILRCFMIEKQFNKILGYVIGVIWCVAAMYGIYFYYTLIMKGILDGLPWWVEDYILLFVGLLGLVFYFVYDRFVVLSKLVADRYLRKIIK